MDTYLTLDNCIGDVNMDFSKKKFKSGPIINRNTDVTLFRNSKMYICIGDALRCAIKFRPPIELFFVLTYIDQMICIINGCNLFHFH